MIVLLNDYKSKVNLKHHVLILPSVSVGNIGQLAVDLLISTLDLKKIGFIRHPNILPVVAHSQANKSIATECEIFGSTDNNIVVLQIRSSYGPFISISSFMSELCNAVKCVVILSGSFAYERKKINLVNDSIRFTSTSPIGRASLAPLPTEWKEIDKNLNLNSRIRIPGSGIADHLFHLCSDENIPAILIVNYVSEGDNRDDAINLVNYVDTWLHLRRNMGKSEKSWNVPNVWSSLFGNSFPAELF